MAPSSIDPAQLRTVLNLARRKALMIVVTSIIANMRVALEDSRPAQEHAPLFADPAAPREKDSSDLLGDESNSHHSEKRLEKRLDNIASTPKIKRLNDAALAHFDRWQSTVVSQLRKVLNAPEDVKAAHARMVALAAAAGKPPPPTDPATELREAQEAAALQALYAEVPTRLATISKDDLRCVISSMILLLLSLGNYSAHSRVLMLYLTSSFALPLSTLVTEETEIAQTLLQASKTLSADAETQKRQADNKNSRLWKVGLASVAGAAVIGITGGLAAPIVAGAIGGIMGGVGLGGVASFLGIFAMNGALMGSLFGAYGAAMTGKMIDTYAREVQDFKFLPVKEEWGVATRADDEVASRRLRVVIGINGWLTSKEDIVKPWRCLGLDAEAFALRYEMDALVELGTSLESMVSSYAWSYVKLEILRRTVLATLWSTLWPVYLLRMATSIDNPFAVARNSSEKAGRVLADALINKTQGERPVTLIGYSLGARVIYSCLNSLAERKAFGLIESVVFIGAPIPSNTESWRVMRSVVSGKLINVFSENDYILAFMYRATSIQLGVAGLQGIKDVEGVDNMNLSAEVNGHLRYPDLIGNILRKTGVVDVQGAEVDIEKEDGIVELIDQEGRNAWTADPDTVKLTKQFAKTDIRSSVLEDKGGRVKIEGLDATSTSKGLSSTSFSEGMDECQGFDDDAVTMIDSEDEGIKMVDNDGDNISHPGEGSENRKYQGADSLI